jgi:hypothetical protein
LSVERWALKKPNIQDRSVFSVLSASKNEVDALFAFLNRFDDLVKVRPFARVKFGMEEFAISANLESAAARRNKRERLDALAELKNFGRQTDGLRRVVSNDAVFDRYLGFHQRAPFRERKYRCDEMRSRNVNGTVLAAISI